MVPYRWYLPLEWSDGALRRRGPHRIWRANECNRITWAGPGSPVNPVEDSVPAGMSYAVPVLNALTETDRNGEAFYPILAIGQR